MVNVFTLQSKIAAMQDEVLAPLYTMHADQGKVSHDWLLAQTGRAIANHQRYIEEICRSKLVAAAFKIVKMLGGAGQLQADDFQRFTNYVNDGGIKAMIKMLLAAEKESVFLSELKKLPADIQQNAPAMLTKSAELHSEYIDSYFRRQFGSINNTPPPLRANFTSSTVFITRLATLAKKNIGT